MLLNVPVELIHREQREDIMKLLMSKASQIQDVPVGCWKLILSLLVQLADRSTVYEVRAYMSTLQLEADRAGHVI